MRALILIAPVALAACGGPAPANDAAAANAVVAEETNLADVAGAADETPPIAGGAGDTPDVAPPPAGPLPAATATPDATPSPVPSASASPAGEAALPPRFRGRWALVPADCEPGRADAKGLMIVQPRLLRFYESRAAVTSVRASGADRIVAELAFNGEGQSWSRTARLQLRDNGRTLVRSDEETAPLRYARCPAEPRR